MSDDGGGDSGDDQRVSVKRSHALFHNVDDKDDLIMNGQSEGYQQHQRNNDDDENNDVDVGEDEDDDEDTDEPEQDNSVALSSHSQQPPRPKKRRATLSKEAVTTLKSWLWDHRFNAYPTEAEKRKLCDQCGLTMVQLCNWFINARRRTLPEMIRRDGGDPSRYTMSRRTASSMLCGTTPTPTGSGGGNISMSTGGGGEGSASSIISGIPNMQLQPQALPPRFPFTSPSPAFFSRLRSPPVGAPPPTALGGPNPFGSLFSAPYPPPPPTHPSLMLDSQQTPAYYYSYPGPFVLFPAAVPFPVPPPPPPTLFSSLRGGVGGGNATSFAAHRLPVVCGVGSVSSTKSPPPPPPPPTTLPQLPAPQTSPSQPPNSTTRIQVLCDVALNDHGNNSSHGGGGGGDGGSGAGDGASSHEKSNPPSETE